MRRWIFATLVALLVVSLVLVGCAPTEEPEPPAAPEATEAPAEATEAPAPEPTEPPEAEVEEPTEEEEPAALFSLSVAEGGYAVKVDNESVGQYFGDGCELEQPHQNTLFVKNLNVKPSPSPSPTPEAE